MTIRAYLKAHDITAKDFADKAGVDRSMIWRYLTGVLVPGPRNIKKIVRASKGEICVEDLIWPSRRRRKASATAAV